MKKLSLFKKIRLFYFFKNILKNHKTELLDVYNARVDKISRIYTVLNIPDDIIKEKDPFTAALTKKYIEGYISEISDFLSRKGIMEMCKFYTVEQVEQYSYLIVIGYKFIDTEKLAKKMMFRYLPLTLIILTISFFVLKHYNIIHLW